MDKIYRLRGQDIHYRIHDTLHLLSRREPHLFSEERVGNLALRSAPEYRRRDVWGTMSSGFPFGTMRYYDFDEEWLAEHGDDLEDESERDFLQPTLICWTEKKA